MEAPLPRVEDTALQAICLLSFFCLLKLLLLEELFSDIFKPHISHLPREYKVLGVSQVLCFPLLRFSVRFNPGLLAFKRVVNHGWLRATLK